MPGLFAITLVHGGAWKAGKPMEAQFDWAGHTGFMDGLVADGFVTLGGPLGDGDEVLLIVRADNAEEIRRRLEWDSWIANDLLRMVRVVPWTLRLGSLDRA